MTDQPMPCRYDGATEPRKIRHRHLDECPAQIAPDDGHQCPGCLPCTARHCAIDGRTHVEQGVCAGCLSDTRDDLHLIADLCDALPTEAAHRGVNSEAAMLHGPSANPEAWRNRAMSAMMGRLPAGYLDDNRDELHPLWVTGTWEQLWREHLDQPTDLAATLPRLVDYLDKHMSRMAGLDEPPFEDFARDLRQCRGRLEDVLSAGEREEKGAPCPKCGKGALVKTYGDRTGDDRWVCRNRECREWWTEHDYREKVAATYERHAEVLTASAIARVYRVPEGSTRAWASSETPTVRRRGKDRNGLQLYDVADVLARRDRQKTA